MQSQDPPHSRSGNNDRPINQVHFLELKKLAFQAYGGDPRPTLLMRILAVRPADATGPRAPWWLWMLSPTRTVPMPLEPYTSQQNGRPVRFFCQVLDDHLEDMVSWSDALGYDRGSQLADAFEYIVAVRDAYPGIMAQCQRRRDQQAELARQPQKINNIN